jgi:hypothetical protein
MQTLYAYGPKAGGYLAEGPNERYLVPADELGALFAQPLIGVIVGVRHLSISDPNDSVSTSSQPEGIPKNGTVDPIAHVACRPAPGSTTTIGEEPCVRLPDGIPGSMAIPNDRDARHCVKYCF